MCGGGEVDEESGNDDALADALERERQRWVAAKKKFFESGRDVQDLRLDVLRKDSAQRSDGETAWMILEVRNCIKWFYRRECERPIAEQIDDAYQFVVRNMRVGTKIVNSQRQEVYELPLSAVREAICNAAFHRDYFEPSNVFVAFFDDRFEITSPGWMPGDRKVQEYTNIRRIPSRRRNKCLADMFERLDLMERKGSGFKKLCEDYEKLAVNLGKRMPVLESENNYFRVMLPNLLYGFTDEQLVAAVDNSSYGVKKGGAKVGTTHPNTPPVTPPADEKLNRILLALKDTELGTSELLKALHIRDRNYLREGYIRPVLRADLIEQTRLEVKHSRLQKYRLTDKGRDVLAASIHQCWTGKTT